MNKRSFIDLTDESDDDYDHESAEKYVPRSSKLSVLADPRQVSQPLPRIGGPVVLPNYPPVPSPVGARGETLPTIYDQNNQDLIRLDEENEASRDFGLASRRQLADNYFGFVPRDITEMINNYIVPPIDLARAEQESRIRRERERLRNPPQDNEYEEVEEDEVDY